jgi:hypothetical protein
MLGMHLDAAIETTHVGHSIVQVAVVMLVKRILPRIINFNDYSLPLAPGFQVVGQI